VTIVLGVDGGGSKTHAVIVDDQGQLLGFATNGPSNWETAGLRGAQDAIREAAERALSFGGRRFDELRSAAFGLAGLDWDSDVPRLTGMVDGMGLPCEYALVNDAFVALRAGVPDGYGVVLVAGTGAVAAGRNRAGKTFRTPGQGAILGDEGSASDVSDEAVRAVANAYTGRGPATALTEELCSLAGCRSAEELLEQYSRGVQAPRTAAPAVMRAAAAGDEVARRIVAWAGRALGESAVLVARRLDMLDQRFDVVLSGGLFRTGSEQLLGVMSEVVHPHAPGARLSPLSPPPVVGAALMALDRLGLTLDGEHRRALEQATGDAVRQRPWMTRP
jgi:N-acetylglucosamine kinase-like BadF-type ATPase